VSQWAAGALMWLSALALYGGLYWLVGVGEHAAGLKGG
jgi:hypothetical protein